MIAIAERKTLRLGVMSALYVAQGIPYGFVTVTLAAWVAARGASEGQVGDLVAFSMLPWAFKWLWAPLVDRFSHSHMGRRRPWIVFAQAMLVCGAGLLLLAPDDDLGLLGWMVLGCNVFASLQDVAVDALAVDLLPEGERGFANGLMYGGSYLGVILGGAVLSRVAGESGLRAAMLGQALMLGSIMLLPLLLREHAGDRLFSLRLRRREVVPGRPGLLRNLARAFGRRSPLVAALLSLVVLLGSQAIAAVLTVLLVQRLGWSQVEYGQMMGGWPLVLGLLGSVAGGWLADRVGHRTMVAGASALLGLLWIAFGLGQPLWADHGFVYAYACGQELLLGTLSAALFALLMGVSWPAVAASQFTAYMALLNLGRTLGARLAGPASEALQVHAVFLAFGTAQVALLLLLFAIDPRQNRRELGEDGGQEPGAPVCETPPP
ncbi:MAG: MFS transporter [Planctomycetes bacterium]|nr:MFS transporter [Planctomycetota bacterium]